MMWYIIMRDKFMDRYRSGHNGTDSKSVVPHGTVGSNPTLSAKMKAPCVSVNALIYKGFCYVL